MEPQLLHMVQVLCAARRSMPEALITLVNAL